MATKHKPLLETFSKSYLGSISNPRIQSLKESTLKWHSDIIPCPGSCARKIFSSLPVKLKQPGGFDSSACSSVENAPENSSIFETNEMRCVTIHHVNTAAPSDP